MIKKIHWNSPKVVEKVAKGIKFKKIKFNNKPENTFARREKSSDSS